MGAATALEAGEGLADLRVGGLRRFFEQRDRGHDPAVEAIAALRNLFGDIGFLQLVRLAVLADTGKRRNLAGADGINRRDAGANRLAVDPNRSGAALGEAASEARIFQSEIVAQRIEQRHIRICFNRMRLAIDIQLDACGHGFLHQIS